jgi:hypothetical protein
MVSVSLSVPGALLVLLATLPGFVLTWTFLKSSGRDVDSTVTDRSIQSGLGSLVVLVVVAGALIVGRGLGGVAIPDPVAWFQGLPAVEQVLVYAGLVGVAAGVGVATGVVDHRVHERRTGNRRGLGESFGYLMRLQRRNMYTTLQLTDPDERVYGQVKTFDEDDRHLTLENPFRVAGPGTVWPSLGTHLYVPGDRIRGITTTATPERRPGPIDRARSAVRPVVATLAGWVGLRVVEPGAPNAGDSSERAPLAADGGGAVPELTRRNGPHWEIAYGSVKPRAGTSSENGSDGDPGRATGAVAAGTSSRDQSGTGARSQSQPSRPSPRRRRRGRAWRESAKEPRPRYVVRGWMRNTAESTLPHGQVIVRFKDAEDHFIGEAATVFSDLRPGFKYRFELAYPGENPRDVSRYTVSHFAAR